jgi:hypothetical protein
MAARDAGLKRWIEAERVRSKLRTLGFAVIYARARYLGREGEFMVVLSPSQEAPASTRLEVKEFLAGLQARWSRRTVK